MTRSCQLMVYKVRWDGGRKRKLRFGKSKEKKSMEVKWGMRDNAPTFRLDVCDVLEESLLEKSAVQCHSGPVRFQVEQ